MGFGINYYTNPWGYVDALGRGFSDNYIFVGGTHPSLIFPRTDEFS